VQHSLVLEAGQSSHQASPPGLEVNLKAAAEETAWVMNGMHWKVRWILGLLVAFTSALPAGAQAQFYYITNYGTITITYYAGSGGAVSIPSAITGLPVTAIWQQAFANSAVTSVTMPDSIYSIGAQAFSYCTNLKAVTLSTNLTLIEDSTFAGCQRLTTIRIPGRISLGRGVANIGDFALLCCTNLNAVYFTSNAPATTSSYSIFAGDCNATVYYLPGTTGWSATLAIGPQCFGIPRWIQPLPALGRTALDSPSPAPTIW